MTAQLDHVSAVTGLLELLMTWYPNQAQKVEPVTIAGWVKALEDQDPRDIVASMKIIRDKADPNFMPSALFVRSCVLHAAKLRKPTGAMLRLMEPPRTEVERDVEAAQKFISETKNILRKAP